MRRLLLAVLLLASPVVAQDDLRNVRVTVTTVRQARGSADHVAGAVRVGPAGGTAAVSGQSRRDTTASRTQQELLVLSGGRAEIEVARESPEASWLWSWGLGQGLVSSTVHWVSVGTSLVVEPRVLPDGRVRVRVVPHLSWQSPTAPGGIDVVSLATEVVVAPGQELDLGGLPARDQEFQERFLLGWGRERQQESVAVRLRAYPE